MKAIFTRLKEDEDKDIIEFLKKQTNVGFAVKFLIRYGIKSIGDKDFISIKKDIGKKGTDEVMNKLL